MNLDCLERAAIEAAGKLTLTVEWDARHNFGGGGCWVVSGTLGGLIEGARVHVLDEHLVSNDIEVAMSELLRRLAGLMLKGAA